MSIILDYFLNAFNGSVNLYYFFTLMFLGELLKMLPFIQQDIAKRKYFIFLSKDKILYFEYKWLILFLGVILGFIFYFFEASELSFRMSGLIILRIFLTFSITMTMYDLFFQLIIVKTKEFISTLIKASIVPVKIDLNSQFGGVSEQPVEQSTDNKNETN